MSIFLRIIFNFFFLVPPIVEIIPKKEINLDNAPSNSDKDKDNAGILPTEDTSVIMNPKPEDRPTSFFSQPGILAGKNCSLFLFILFTECLLLRQGLGSFIKLPINIFLSCLEPFIFSSQVVCLSSRLKENQDLF